MRAGAQERRKTVQRNSRPPDRILGQKSGKARIATRSALTFEVSRVGDRAAERLLACEHGIGSRKSVSQGFLPRPSIRRPRRPQGRKLGAARGRRKYAYAPD